NWVWYNNKIFNFNTSNKKINQYNNNKIFSNTLLIEHNDIYTIFGDGRLKMNENIIKNNEIIYQNSKYIRYGHTGILYKNNVYIFGGYNRGETYLNDLLIYNLDTNTIKRYKTKLKARFCHKAVLYGNEMYI